MFIDSLIYSLENMLQELIGEGAYQNLKEVFCVIVSVILLCYLLNNSGVLGSIVHTAKTLRGRK